MTLKSRASIIVVVNSVSNVHIVRNVNIASKENVVSRVSIVHNINIASIVIDVLSNLISIACMLHMKD